MQTVQQKIEALFTEAVVAAFGEEHRGVDPLVRKSAGPKFGDFQANLAMSLKKRVGIGNPREVAQRILENLDQTIFDKVDIAGPGFINLTISADVLAQGLVEMRRSPGIGLPAVGEGKKVVVDYSSPNVAKEMHVGHLRSTVIGDTIVRVLEALGYEVIRQNHIGDWGTQFGLLIELLIERGTSLDSDIGDLNTLYQEAKKRADNDEDFSRRARERVVALQGGDPQSLEIWTALIEASKAHFNELYAMLGVRLTDDDIAAESFYNPELPGVIEALEAGGHLSESKGAKVIYPAGFKNKDGDPLPMIVQKADGGYLYATTDLAAARHRVDTLGASRIIIVTDSRQAQHFAMLFQALRQVGWAPAHKVRLEHVPFGTILGPDNKPFKTREGGTIRLKYLLEEAVARAGTIRSEREARVSEQDAAAADRAVGIGALKFADLSSNRVKDYVFDWERMLSFEGNTAPYVQNAYVRTRSIFRKGGVDPNAINPEALKITDPFEKSLALKMLDWPEVVQGVADNLEPHRLCHYLFELSGAYHSFFENCPVIKAGVPDDVRQSRLALIEMCSRIMASGLDLLGVETLEAM